LAVASGDLLVISRFAVDELLLEVVLSLLSDYFFSLSPLAFFSILAPAARKISSITGWSLGYFSKY
jgi:hypothetical protein